MTEQDKKNFETEQRSIYIETESNANKFNLKILVVVMLFVLIAAVLNRVGIFLAPRMTMTVCVIVSAVCFLTPVIIFIIHDKVLKRGSITENAKFKYYIVILADIGVSVVCTALSFHTAVLLAIPCLFAAQYRDQKKLFPISAVITLLLVPISIYGAYFFGMADKNLLKTILTDEEAVSLSARLELATPKRMFELFYHYVMPRLLCVGAIVVMASGITRRNNSMVNSLAELSERIRKEMEYKEKIQGHVTDALASVIENRDEGTGGHVARTKAYVGIIAHAMQKDPVFADKLPDEELERIVSAAPLHDVGKIAVSDTILLKPGKLTPEEFEKMKVHTVEGGRIIRNIFADLEDKEFLNTAEEIATSHHEKWNGQGYPRGLSNDQIPISARIMAVADVFDALISERVYKKAMPPEEAFSVILSGSGTHFDPDIIRIVTDLKAELFKAAGADNG